MKKIFAILGICSMAICGIVKVNAYSIEPYSTIDYTTTDTKQYFTGNLGYATFTSVMKYNNKTSECSIADRYSKGFPKSGYTYSVTNGSAGSVTYSGGKIIITWKWTLKDTRKNLVDSGTEKHIH